MVFVFGRLSLISNRRYILNQMCHFQVVQERNVPTFSIILKTNSQGQLFFN